MGWATVVSKSLGASLVAVAILGATMGCKAPAPPAPAPSQEAPQNQQQMDALFAATDIAITLDEFEQIRPGMSHDDVVAVIGDVETSTKSKYTPGSDATFTRPRTAIIHRWENPDGSFCEIEFVDRVVDLKRHQDLKPASAYAGTKYTLPESRVKKP